MENIRLKLSPPWTTYVNEIKALFGNDPEIEVVYDNQNVEVRIFVQDNEKAAAIATLLPTVKKFGNVPLDITVIPANNAGVPDSFWQKSMKEMYEIMFKNNPVFAFVKEVEYTFSDVVTYVVFKNRVVQFFNDNLNDVYGNCSTLYQNIAYEVFEKNEIEPVFYCTDVEERVTNAPKEWV